MKPPKFNDPELQRAADAAAPALEAHRRKVVGEELARRPVHVLGCRTWQQGFCTCPQVSA